MTAFFMADYAAVFVPVRDYQSQIRRQIMYVIKMLGSRAMATFLDVVPRLAEIWPSMGEKFLERLRGELKGSDLSKKDKIEACANRIKDAYLDLLPERDEYDVQGDTIQVYEGGYRGQSPRCHTSLKVTTSDDAIEVTVTAFCGRSVRLTVREEKFRYSYGLVIEWEIHFKDGSMSSAGCVRDILDELGQTDYVES